MNKTKIYQIIRRLTDGMLSESGRRIVVRWLRGQEHVAETDEAMFRIWNEIDGAQVSDEETKVALQAVKRRIGLSERRIGWKQMLWKYAAIILLPLITGLTVWQVMNFRVLESSDMIECYVPLGEQKKIILSDGTEVMLNSGTLFIYPEKFYGENRKVFLSGEAYFEVEHDKEKPFVVRTGPLAIRVLGTTFNVEAYPGEDEITTTLKTGRVKVYRTDDETKGLTMNPDDRVVYHNKDDRFELFRVEAEVFTSWTEGETRFVDRPLSEVLKTLERRYDVTFRYDKSINLNEMYTMKFKPNETIEEVMRILMLAGSNMEYSIDGNVVFLRSTGKGGAADR